MQPSSTLQPVGTQQHVETHPGTIEAEEQSLPSIDLPPDADFYGDYLQKLKEITWRFEISLETYLMERGINRERKPISSWKTRIKSPDSMREKLIKRGYEPTAENAVYAMHDAAGVRVICPLVDDVASVAQFIRELPCFEVVQEKDYILHPKPNGYRSYHMILARTNDSELDPDATRRAAAKAAIALLRNDNAGRATFLPLDTVQPGVFRGRLTGSARLASSLVQADARYANIVSNLLGRIVVVDDINEASRVARDLGYHNKVVTLDGQVVNAGGSFTGGSVQRSAGLFTRKQELEELRVKAAKLQKDCLAAQEKTDQCKAQMDAVSAELTAANSEQITAANDRVRAEAERKRLEAAVEQAETALAARRKEIDTLNAQRTESRTRAAEAEGQEAECAAALAEKSAELQRIAEGDDAFLTRQRELADQLSAKRLEQITRQKDAELAQAQIAALEQRTRDAAARKASLEESLTALADRSAVCRAEIEAIRKAKSESAEQIAAKEAEIRRATEERLTRQKAETEALARARTAADEREEMSREMARLAERKAAAESEYDATAAKLWDEYQLTVSQAEALCVDFDSLSALRAQAAEVRNKIRALGSVNVRAIEEYREVKARYDTLRVQVADVEGSRNELSRMISQLSSQMREIFTDSFRAINENFGRIFAELFGGGEASLVLEDESDVLGCGIGIRVAPPGKVIKNLEALSGGEQALVAISIYFAILAVNPAPFCILDEIEAALDDANVSRFAQYLRRVSDRTQFIVITHRRGTMEAANVLYGVTMQEDGVSKLLKLDLEQVDATLVS